MARAKQSKVAKVARYTVDDEKSYDFELESMTLGERIEVEEYLEKPWPEIAGTAWLFSEKAQAILAFIAIRRKKSDARFEDVLNARKIEVEYDPKDPTEGSKGTPDKSGSRS